MRHTQEGNICDSKMNSVFVFVFLFFFPAGDSSLTNVTLRDEEEVNKHNGSFSLWDPETVTLGSNKKKREEKTTISNLKSQPKSY